jgi:hypothetical protein
MRREVPLFITMVVGIFMVVQYFMPHPWVVARADEIQAWTTIVLAFAYVLGVANVVRINVIRIQRKQRDWIYAIPLLLGVAVMLGLGVFRGVEDGTLFNKLYTYAYSPMQGTMFALLSFYIASAAYRAFRIRTLEAGLLAVTALLVMLGRVPIGTKIWAEMPDLTDWIMNVPNLAAKRAILIGAALGAISTGLKIILGIEKNYLGGE